MIYIALNVIFNALILAIVLFFSINIVHISVETIWCLAYIIVGSLTIIGYTRFATSLVGLFMSGRAMIGREKAKLEPLLQDVITNTNREYGTNYKLSDFKIRVTDNKVVNALALGYNTIIINRGAFDAFTDGQLLAIMAHEMGHLYYRDSVRIIALIFSSFTTRIIMLIYSIYVIFSTALTQDAEGGCSGVMALVSLIPLLFFLPVIMLNWIGSKLFYLLNMKMSRRAEYRADAFVASLGYKADMIEALEVIDEISVYDNSFVAKLMVAHPATLLRIGALEDEEVSKQKIGGLFVATPFASTNSTCIGGNNEVMRLSVIIMITGILWCGFIFNLLNKQNKTTNYSTTKNSSYKYNSMR